MSAPARIWTVDLTELAAMFGGVLCIDDEVYELLTKPAPLKQKREVDDDDDAEDGMVAKRTCDEQ